MPVKTPKKALVAELTSMVLPVLTQQDSALTSLPRGVAQAVEQVADAILRWQTRQQAPSLTRDRSTRTESDELTGLLADRFHHESDEQLATASAEDSDGSPIVPPTTVPTKKHRPRLRKGE